RTARTGCSGAGRACRLEALADLPPGRRRAVAGLPPPVAGGRSGGDPLLEPAADAGDDVVAAVHHLDVDIEAAADEALLAHVVEQADEGIPELLDVDEHDRLAVLAELGPGHHLDGFLERPEAAGQRDEGVGLREHVPLALVHALGDDQFLGVAQHLFALAEELRDDAGDVPAGREDGPGHDPHQPEAPATVDEADSVAGKFAAQNFGSLGISRVAARTGAAVHADTGDVIHRFIWHSRT